MKVDLIKRFGFAMMLVLMLSVVSAIGRGADAAAESKGKYVSDLQFSFSGGVNVPSEWANRVPDSDSWNRIDPDGENEDEKDLQGWRVFAYAKAYVKRTDDAGKALRDITIWTDYDGESTARIKGKNKKVVIYDCVLPQTRFYNALYTTRNTSSGDPICDVFFVKDSLDCNGAEYALNTSSRKNKEPVIQVSYSAREYELHDKKIPVYTVFLRDKIAKKYVKDLMLVKGDTDKEKTELIAKGYTILKIVELGGEPYTLGIARTDETKEALRGVYFVKDGSLYKLYTSKSEGAGAAIVDVCPENEMLVSKGETTTVGKWTQKYFQGDGFRDFVKSFILKSDTAYKKNKGSSYGCTAGEVKQYDDLSVLKADMGFEESIRDGVDVEAGSAVSDTIAVVRRNDTGKTGDIIISGVKGTGTSDPEKLESYRAQIEPEEEASPEDDKTPDVGAVSGDSVSGAAAETTGTITSSGAWLWIVLSVAVVLIVAVVIIYVRKKRNKRGSVDR